MARSEAPTLRKPSITATPIRLPLPRQLPTLPLSATDPLKTAGCRDADIYTDKASGARGSRPGLDACVKALESGDTLVVWRLDRLGRSMPHLVSLVEELLGKGIGFRSLQDGAIDTTTASGELMFNVFSSLAQFESRLIQEHTRAGLAAARARGRKGGRRPIRPDDPRS